LRGLKRGHAVEHCRLHDELAVSSEDDPLKTIRTLSKVRGFLGAVTSYAMEVRSVLAEYEIDDIPLDL